MAARTAPRRRIGSRRITVPAGVCALLMVWGLSGPVPAHAAGLPTLSIDSPRVIEGNPAPSVVPVGPPTVMTFTVTLSAVPTEAASVRYTTVPLAPADVSDFVSSTGQLVWAPGDAVSKTFDVLVISDTEVESDEEVRVTLYAPIGAVSLSGLGLDGTGTILNDDRGPRYSFSSPSVCEGSAGTLTTLTLNVGLVDLPDRFTGRVAAAWGLSTSIASGLGRADANLDFVDASGNLVWDNDPTTPAPGYGTKQQVSVTVIGDDTPELDETLTIGLLSPINSGFGSPPVDRGFGVIRNDDGASCG